MDKDYSEQSFLKCSASWIF